MTDTVWSLTLEGFNKRVGGRKPVPAGVAAAAVSGCFGISLLIKVLEIAKRRKAFAGDATRVSKLLKSSQNQLANLRQFADADIAVFSEYLASRQLPQATIEESDRRKEAIVASLRRATEVPMAVASSATAGLELCAEASGSIVPGALAADLSAAVVLLGATVRIACISAKSNLQLLSYLPFRNVAMSKVRDLEVNSRRLAESVLKVGVNKKTPYLAKRVYR